MTCRKCNHDTAYKFGTYGKRRIQRYRCSSCRATFADPNPKIGRHYTAPELATKALSMMLEGMSVRAISRITGLHLQTILALMNTAAKAASAKADALLRGLRPNYVQADEIWCYVGKKQKQVRHSDSDDLGDAWVFTAIDEESKLILAHTVGKRTRPTTYQFLLNLRSRLATDERFQLTTDGYAFYERGVEDVFGGTVDFAQLVKLYGEWGQHGTERYSPSPIVEVISKIRDGRPDPKHICTSHAERSNLSIRMHLRRFTRLTNAFSKKLDNLKAALGLYFAWYNFCRVHQSLRITPAMHAGIANHVWSMEELVGIFNAEIAA